MVEGQADMVGQEGMGQAEVSDHARCTKRSAPAVKLSAKFLSSRPRVDLFTAGTALQNNHAEKDIKTPIILPSNWDFGPVCLGWRQQLINFLFFIYQIQFEPLTQI